LRSVPGAKPRPSTSGAMARAAAAAASYWTRPPGPGAAETAMDGIRIRAPYIAAETVPE